MHACFQYDFHPVGQGLFASGCLYWPNIPEPKFLWVYDCGSATHKAAQFWTDEARKLHNFVCNKPEIDLLTLSHFDDDHINGVTALLAQFDVRILLLPYVPLWRRLLVAFSQGVPNDPNAMAPFIDPVTFLQGLGRIHQVVLVLPGGGGALPPEGGRGDIPDGALKPTMQTKSPSSDDPLLAAFGTNSRTLEFLVPGGVINVQSLWEFCPYNVERTDVPPDFALRVAALKDDLLAADVGRRDTALRVLKQEYDDAFGKTGPQRNVISLFLYGGPVYPTWSAAKLLGRHDVVPPQYTARRPCYYRAQPYAPGLSEKCSVLYSGDSYLDTPASFDSLHDFMGMPRMEKLGVFQVNHHGARANWHQGLARRIDSVLSVFSSDPQRGNTFHPHADVWNDYQLHGRFQVNTIGHHSGGWMLQ